MNVKLLILQIFLLLFLWRSESSAQRIVVDSSFGKEGTVETFGSSGYADAYSLKVQADGKVVVCGSRNDDILLLRYLENGKLDSSFGKIGVVLTDINNESADNADYIVLQDDKRIVVVGTSKRRTSNDSSYTVLLRYLEDGRLDSSFASTGKKTIFGPKYLSGASGLHVYPNNKILIAGSTSSRIGLKYSTEAFVIKINDDGSVDSSFSPNVQVVNSLSTKVSCSDFIVDLNGNMYLSGIIEGDYDSNSVLLPDQFYITKLSPDGQIDTNFGEGGVRLIQVVKEYTKASSMRIELQGSKGIIASTVERCRIDSFTDSMLTTFYRFTYDGQIDSSFALGKVTLPRYNENYSVVGAFMKVLPDNKILMIGALYSKYNGSQSYLVRLTADGYIDSLIPSGVYSGYNGSLDVGSGGDYAFSNDEKFIYVEGSIIYRDADHVTAADISLTRLKVLSNLGTRFSPNRENALKVIPSVIHSNKLTILFDLRAPGYVSAGIYDVKGILLQNLMSNEVCDKGKQERSIHLENINDGIYFIKLVSDDGESIVKFIKN